MRIIAGGFVGIGKTPSVFLDLNLTGTANIANSTITKVTDFAAAGSFGFSGLADNNNGVYFGMGAGGSGIPAGIGFMREATGWNTALAFYTNNITSGPNSTNAMQEKMRITSGGNVGIGVTAPVNKLEVNGAIVATGAAAGYSANMTIIDVASGNSNITAIGPNTSTIGTTVFQSFSSNASLGGERMRITSGGQFLFGKTDENLSRWGRANFFYPAGTSNAIIALQNATARASGNLYGMTFVDNTDETNAAVYVRQTGTNNQADLLFGTNSGTGGAGLSSVTERVRILSSGVLKSGINSSQATSECGVASWNTVGTIGGNASLTFDITVPDDNGMGTGHHIEANMTHINFGSYGCLLDTWISTRGTGIQEQQDIKNVTSGNGGSWTVTKPNSTTLRVTKNAGTYVGSGYYWIKVTTVSVI